MINNSIKTDLRGKNAPLITPDFLDSVGFDVNSQYDSETNLTLLFYDIEIRSFKVSLYYEHLLTLEEMVIFKEKNQLPGHKFELYVNHIKLNVFEYEDEIKVFCLLLGYALSIK